MSSKASTVVRGFLICFLLVVNAEAASPIVYETAKLVASDADLNDYFGYSITVVDEDTILVGAYHDDIGGHDDGSAYVFTRSNGIWTEAQKLTASDKSDLDNAGFGYSMAADGDTAIIGAWQDTYDGHIWQGAAYVFTRSNGVWSESQKLTASDAVDGEFFGQDVAIDGDTAVIGAPGSYHNGVRVGAAYVFTRSNGVWSEQQKLTASDGAVTDFFGRGLSIDDSTIVIGSPRDDNITGSAYVFTRSNGVWTEQQKLTASDGEPDDWFGQSSQIDVGTIMIGSRDDDKGEQSGSVYVFTNNNGPWEEQQKLLASDGANFHSLSEGLFLDGGYAIAGAPGFDRGGYVFTRSAGIWSETVRLRSLDNVGFGNLGGRVSVSGSTVVLSNSAYDIGALENAGAVFVYNIVLNKPPVAVAGNNQSVHAGVTIQLDGSGSYDAETASEDLLYAWQLVQVPAGSVAALTGSDTATPSFVADIPGDYTARLVVTDEGGLQSEADEVTVSSVNAPPNAEAGPDLGTYIGALVTLDGSGSSDPDNDPLTYVWAIISQPEGGTAVLSDADQVAPFFYPDLAGAYEIELIVNDGYADSAPDSMTVLVASIDDYVCERTTEALNIVANLPDSSFRTKGDRTAFSNFLTQGCTNSQKGNAGQARHKLEQALERTDGCVLRGESDTGADAPLAKDYIINCPDQLLVYPLIVEALNALSP